MTNWSKVSFGLSASVVGRRPGAGQRRPAWAGAAGVAVGDELDLGSVAEHVAAASPAGDGRSGSATQRADRRLGREHEALAVELDRPQRGEPELGGLRVDDASQLAADLRPRRGRAAGGGQA